MVIVPIMKILRRLFHPLFTFIGIQVLWILVLFFWIYWFLGRHRQFKELASRYQAQWLPETTDWLILTEGILLLVAILIGIYVIFIYWRRQAALNKAQIHFINQVTHELKSPLASLQLHLETIQLRPPSPEQLQKFAKLMESDCRRLDGLITNLLTAGRVEHKGSRLTLQRGNLSQVTEAYLTRELARSLTDVKLSWEIEPELYVRFEKDSYEIVLRNLLENAVLYSEGTPVVEVKLTRKDENAHLIIKDEGRGIPAQHQKKVFRMFYRIRQGGRSIRGSGLGLFIVWNIVRLHKGKIWLDSPGKNLGTACHLTFPLERENDS